MGIGGSGFAYDAVRMIARAIEERRANREYWREIRRRRVERYRTSWPEPEPESLAQSVAAQLDHDVYVASPRECPQCHQTFVLINVRGVELDTCLDCGSFWLDAGEFGSLTAHEEIIAQSSPCGNSAYLCPLCADSMIERQVITPTELKIDACRNGHGIYFERGELMKIFAETL